VGFNLPGGGLKSGQRDTVFPRQTVKVRGGHEEVAKTYLEVYFGSQRRALAVVILLAICSGEGGVVLAREEDEVDKAC